MLLCLSLLGVHLRTNLWTDWLTDIWKLWKLIKTWQANGRIWQPCRLQCVTRHWVGDMSPVRCARSRWIESHSCWVWPRGDGTVTSGARHKTWWTPPAALSPPISPHAGGDQAFAINPLQFQMYYILRQRIGNWSRPRNCPKFQTNIVQLICDHRPVIALVSRNNSGHHCHSWLDLSPMSAECLQLTLTIWTRVAAPGVSSRPVGNVWHLTRPHSFALDDLPSEKVWTTSCHHVCITNSCSFTNGGLVLRHRLQVCVPAMNSSAGFPDLFLGN